MKIWLKPLTLVSLGFVSSLLAQPYAPVSPVAAPPELYRPGTAATTVDIAVDTSDRGEARQFYRAVYSASEGIPIAWTGNYTSGVAGDTSEAWKEAVALRINWFRAMAGIPSDIIFSSTYSAKAQQAALMMSANNSLSHYPPSNWLWYTADGYEAAGNSNLTLGDHGPSGITGLMRDEGANNTAVGHRRWFLYPQTKLMGAGDVPGNSSYMPAQAVWVIDSMYGTTRPSTRDGFVGWPPAGYVPHNLVFPRWSFSYPGADFSSATLTVTRNGNPVSVEREATLTGFGENTLVWYVDGEKDFDLARPDADTPYAVSLTNVLVGGQPRSFSYVVTVMDPRVASESEVYGSIAGASTVGLGQSSDFTASGPGYATSLEWRAFSVSAQSSTFGAEGGLQGLVAAVGSYTPRTTERYASGTASYHLTHLQGEVGAQTLTLPESYYVPLSGTRQFAFKSRLGYATTSQFAGVELSLDDGISWSEIWSQQGTTSSGDTSFSSKTIDLSSYSGRTLRFRLKYSFDFLVGGGSYYYGSDYWVGWLVDDITLPGLQLVTVDSAPQTAEGGAFSYTRSTAGTFYLQARGVMDALFPMEWGLAKALATTTPPTLVNFSVRAVSLGEATPLTLGFSISGGSRNLLLRAIGPTLHGFGVTSAVDDSILRLFQTVGGVPALLASNDDWYSSANPAALQAAFTSTGAFALATDSKDGALLVSATGNRTALGHSSSQQGVILVEGYVVNDAETGRVLNASARNYAGTDQDVLILGFTVSGTTPMKLLIRAVGSELTGFGVPSAIQNTILELYQGSTVIASNDEWDAADKATLQAAFSSTYAFPLTDGSGSAALIVNLDPGSYTAQLKGVGGAVGEGLVEIYVMP